MITNSHINYRVGAGKVGDSSLGNMLFKIAGPIGIATKKGYSFGFPKWVNQEHFETQLPVFDRNLRKVKVQGINIDGYNIDFGFKGFEYPDDIDLNGEFGSWKYFAHCDDLIRQYFTLKYKCEPIKDTIIMHYRYYNLPGWVNLTSYYKEALKKLPSKPVLVVTDNIDEAYKSIGINCDYTSNSPIMDFYLLCHADYMVMANSTFSWWGAYLSKAMTVAPLDWYAGVLKNAPKEDLYLPNWILV